MTGYPHHQSNTPFSAVVPGGGHPPPQKTESAYPPPPHATYPSPSKSGSSTPKHSVYPQAAASPSPFSAVVPSPAVFPPGTDPNAVACFHAADLNGEGLIDDVELQKGLSLYHHTFSIGTVRLLMFVYTNFSVTKIGPAEFAVLYDSLKSWKAIFEKFDSDRSGKIEIAELGTALESLGFAVPPPVLELLVVKYGSGEGIEYDNFIECCLIVKGLSDKFMEKDTSLSGSITFTIEAFLLTILPFITVAEPMDPPPTTTAPRQPPSPYPQSSTPTYRPPPQRQSSIPNSPSYPPPPQRQTSVPTSYVYLSQSPFAAIVPSPVVFPPDTDPNAVACFKLADQSGEGLIDDLELQKGLSLYHHTFSIRTVRLLMFVYTNFSTTMKIGPVEFVTVYNSLKTWKAIFEKFDSDYNGKIDIAELGNALVELGFVVPALVLKLLIAKYGSGPENDKGIGYDNFIECCLIVKALSDKFKEKDTTFCGSITLTIESFLLTVLPFIPTEEPIPSPAPPQVQPPCPPNYPPSPAPSYPPQAQSPCPPSSTPSYPPQPQPHRPPSSKPSYPPSPSPFAAVVPSPVVFPPGADANAVACFKLAYQNCEGRIDAVEIQKALSLYHHTFNIHTVHMLIFVYTNFSTTTKIGSTDFVKLYNSLKSWKAIFEKFDSNRSGKIEVAELGNALVSLGFAVPPQVLELLVIKFGCGCGSNKGIEYDNFIGCCLIVKGLSVSYPPQQATCPPPQKQHSACPPSYPPQGTCPPPKKQAHSSYPPPSSTPPYPPPLQNMKTTTSSSAYPLSAPSPSPFAAVVPSPVVFPPGTDANAVACFQVADQNGEGLINDFELQKGLSLYHHTFNIHTVRLLIFVYTNSTTIKKIGPTEFVTLYNNLKTWKVAFETYDSDRSGKIEVGELGNAFISLGFSVPPPVLELLVAKYGCGCENTGIEYDNFIECCLIVKGLSDKFKDKDTALCGSITLTIEAFLLTILPFIFPAEPNDPLPTSSQPPKTPPQAQSSYPPSYPPQSGRSTPAYPSPGSSPSPFAAVVPSPVVFPPGTDPNAVACFQLGDHSGEGLIDDFELQKGLSLYHHTFNIHTVRLLMFVYTNSTTVKKIGPTEFVTLYNNLKTWKVAFETYDSDRSGKIEVGELGNAFISLGFSVPPPVLELLVAKYGCGCENTGIEYDNFIECCLIVKGLSDKFKDKDTALCGSITLTIEAFLLTILPLIFPAEPNDPLPTSSQPPKTPPQAQSSYPPSYPPQSGKSTPAYPPPGFSPSRLTVVVPSPVVFPPGTDPNAVACFQSGDQSGEGLIDDVELQKGLSLYHHTFNIHTVRLLIFVYTDFSPVRKIGPTEFVTLYNSLTIWKATFEKYDSDRSGKIEANELGNAMVSLGFAVPPPVLEMLVEKFGSGDENKGIEYDNFIECCLIAKGLSAKFQEKDTKGDGTAVTFDCESFLFTILPFIFPAEPNDPPPSSSQPPKTPPQNTPSYPSSSTPAYPPPESSPSPFAAVVPSPAVFPPDTDPNAVACFQLGDQSGEGLIDDGELQKGLSLYHHTFSIHTVRLLIFVYTDFSPVRKIGSTEFVTLYNSLTIWKATFEEYDIDRSGKIEANELGNAMVSLGFAVPPPVLEMLVEKFGSSDENNKGIEYDNFIECCLIAKGLSAKFQEKDTKGDGTAVTFDCESFLFTILPFIFPAEPNDPPPPSSSQPPKTPPQNTPSYPSSSTPAYPPPGSSPSPFAAVVPSPAVFPPDTDPNAVACFQLGDQSGEGLIDDGELQKGLSLYHHTFSIHTVRLLIFVYTDFSPVRKIGSTEFVTLYNSLTIWKATFEEYDIDRSGKIEANELGNAMVSLGFAVPPPVLEMLVEKFGSGDDNNKGIEYDNFIECCLIAKGLSAKFQEKDTKGDGTAVTFDCESFLLTLLPFVTV